MRGKRIFYSELVYFVGITVLAFSAALMERANLSFGKRLADRPHQPVCGGKI